MRLFIIILTALLIPSTVFAECKKEPVKIGVIDTGFGYEGAGSGARLCDTGHKNFTCDQSVSHLFNLKDNVPLDKHRHGTNLVGVIEKYAKEANADYCIVVIKFYSPNCLESNTNNLINALAYASDLKLDILNLSLGGDTFIKSEQMYIKKMLDSGTTVVAAAGNEYADMDKKPYYPAMDDERIVVVGNINKDGTKAEASNTGKAVDRWEVGVDVEGYGIVLSGTSQSTAVASGKIVKEKFNCEK